MTNRIPSGLKVTGWADPARLDALAVQHSLEWYVKRMMKDDDAPNPLFSDFRQDGGPGGLYRPIRTTDDFLSFYFSAPYLPTFLRWDSVADPQPPSVEEEFEVNLMEPLVGWRQWAVDVRRKCLRSLYNHPPFGPRAAWKPDVTQESKCYRQEHSSPAEHCECGIYALSDRSDVLNYEGETVAGEVYGWGRYVRGDGGWRAQFCYPKSFHLSSSADPDVVGLLRQYHVPIYLDVPTRMYSPEEDGYEHREDQTHGDLRTAEVADAAEDPDADPDDDPQD